MKQFLLLALGLALHALPVTTAVAQDKPMIEEVKARGVLHAGVKNDAPYMGFVDDKGNLAGFEIDLIVDIGRNTSKERFAVLDQYLTWNGKDGEGSGRVTKAVLSIFEGLFEARRLKYSKHDLQNAEGGSSNPESRSCR